MEKRLARKPVAYVQPELRLEKENEQKTAFIAGKKKLHEVIHTPAPTPTSPRLTFVPRDRDDVTGGGRHAKDVSALDTPFCLHVVLEGAVDPR